jgi:hypothetical protein
MHVFDFLDLDYLIRLTSTNSYLKGLVTGYRLQKTMLLFECSDYGEYTLAVAGFMPCHGYVRIVPDRDFFLLDSFSKYGLCCAKASERRCSGCDEKAFKRLVDQETEDHAQSEWESDFE